MSWFKQGYDAVDEEAKRVDEKMNKEWLPDFYLNEDEEAQITMLTDEPFTFYQHYIPQLKSTFTCTQEPDCPFCQIGNKPSFRGAFLLIDHREDEWEDKDGDKKQAQYQLKVMNHGITALKVMKRKDEKFGLLEHDWNIARTGTGSNTQYSFERLERSTPDDIPYPEKEEIPEIKEVLKPIDRKDAIRKLAQAGLGNISGVDSDDIDEDEEIIDF